MFWCHFRATGQLRTVFWTSFSLLSKDAKFKQIECCAQCFDENVKQQDSCAQCFAQGLAFLEKLPISRTKTVSQSVLTPSLSNRTDAHALSGKFKLFNRSRQIQAKRQFRRVFWRQFEETGKLRTVFWTSLSFSTKVANFKQNERCAVCFDANFGQQDFCAQSLGQVLAC